MRSLFFFTAANVFVSHEPTDEYEQLQLKLAKKLYRSSLNNLRIVAFSYSIFVIGPVFGYFYSHLYSIPTGTIIPFLDPDSSEGFMINVAIQSVIGMAGMCGVIGIEAIIGIVNGTIHTLSGLTIFHIQKFDENVINNPDSGNRMKEFGNIMRMTEDIVNYSEIVNEVFYWRVILQPFFTTLCSAIGILCQYVV